MSVILIVALAPVFFTLALGWFAGYRAIIDSKNTHSINLMLMNFALPASLFVAMARTPIAVLRVDSMLVLCLAAVMFIIFAVTWALQTYVFRRSPEETAVQSLTVAFPNCAAVGLSLLPAIFGPSGQQVAAIGIAVGAVTVSPFTIALLERAKARQETGSTANFSSAFLHAFRRPVVFSPILGVLLAISGIGLHDTVAKVLLLLGQGAAGIALFLTGLILSSQRFRFTASMGAGVLLKNFVQPAMIFLLLMPLHLPFDLKAEAILLSAVPAGFFGAVFGARFGVQSSDASATLVASTVFGVITLAATIYLLKMMHP